MENVLSARDDKINSLLHDKEFIIPHYQRFYTWDRELIKDLIIDLYDNHPGYFIGLIILSKENDHTYNIVDGQQRIISLSIIISTLRDLSERYEIKTPSGEDFHTIIQNNISKHESREYTRVPLIKPISDIGNDFYNEFIIKSKKYSEKEISELPEEAKLIYENYLESYEFFYNKIEELENPEKFEIINSFLNKIKEALIVLINVTNDISCYEIFETVNAKGKELSSSDKIKNLIFKNYLDGKDIEFQNKKNNIWIEISEELSNYNISMSQFIRYFWISKYKKVSDKNLYKEINNKVTNYEEFFNDLIKYSEIYSVVHNPSKENLEQFNIPIEYSKKISRSINAIRSMDVKQALLLIVAMFEENRVKPNKLYEILIKLEKFCFAYYTVCHKSGNSLETRIALMAQALNKQKGSDITSFVVMFENMIDELMPEELEMAVKLNSLQYNSKTALPIRHSFFNIYAGNSYDIDNFNIEHLLPLNPNRNLNILKKDLRKYVNKIGNLTILERTLNNECGNNNPIDKTSILNRSELNANKSLDLSSWTDNFEYHINIRESLVTHEILKYYYS
tara:strand:- start:1849 stop:3546 length:1698 start_codon:yes stop_codon:yes gene_type:complete